MSDESASSFAFCKACFLFCRDVLGTISAFFLRRVMMLLSAEALSVFRFHAAAPMRRIFITPSRRARLRMR